MCALTKVLTDHMFCCSIDYYIENFSYSLCLLQYVHQARNNSVHTHEYTGVRVRSCHLNLPTVCNYSQLRLGWTKHEL